MTPIETLQEIASFAAKHRQVILTCCRRDNAADRLLIAAINMAANALVELRRAEYGMKASS